MATVNACEDGVVAAAPAVVYAYIADMRNHHPQFLPDAFSDFEVESGGVGAGTVTRFTVTAGGRSRKYHMTVAEPEPGKVLTETDGNSSLVTTFTVDEHPSGSLVRICSTWQGAGGVRGVFERLFAPGAMRRIYADEIARLGRYAADRSPQQG